ncbi:MAG: tRNA preQ1(34) S-adenosylmethionine ribosyltransferase-isomerase QueA [Planctomycetota bacterium]|jgi:S-adenosylmethionine:tRNA ribosyltransferase-isomerase
MLSHGNIAPRIDVSTEQHELPVEALEYPLPERLIATRPAQPRDAARLLVLRRSSGEIEHRSVRDLPDYARPGDVMVFNDTAVTPARLIARRTDSGGRVEGLFLAERADGAWRVMLRSNGRLRPGLRLDLLDAADRRSGLTLDLIDRLGSEWIVRPTGDGDAASRLDATGRTPLPPYILRARGDDIVEDRLDRTWYQTVYADDAKRHSVAAPTAGLHFTTRLLERLDAAGITRTRVTLHVGPGTFKPIAAATLSAHEMHREWFEIPGETLQALREGGAADSGGARPRVIAVGTTSVRALESLPDPVPLAGPVVGETGLLIAPPHRFRHVDGMMTNFHLPRSTLLALVAAMVGLDRIKAVYAEAIERDYRFYSYGDAMLILP